MFSGAIKARRNAKTIQFRITFDSKLKIVQRHPGKYCHSSLSSMFFNSTHFSYNFAGNFAREFLKCANKRLNCSYKP